MNIDIRSSFSKDIDKIHDKKILSDVFEIINNMEQIQSIRELKKLKKIKGSKKHYRIRVGEYRMGVFIENKVITFLRLLHRREIYKYFA